MFTLPTKLWTWVTPWPACVFLAAFLCYGVRAWRPGARGAGAGDCGGGGGAEGKGSGARTAAPRPDRLLEEGAPLVPRVAPPAKPKRRDGKCDLAKLFLQIMVVVSHFNIMMRCDVVPCEEPRFYFQVALSWKMHGFAFLSGIFSSKADITSMARTCCFTLGTSALLWWLIQALHLASERLFGFPQIIPFGSKIVQMPDGTWYLICLFWWRLTISPLFLLVGAGSARVWAFAALFLFTYLIYDTVHSTLFRLEFLSGGLINVETLSMAPVFALGLVLPVSGWSKLLGHRSLQLAGGCLLLAWIAAMSWSASFRHYWMWEYSITDHWLKGPEQTTSWPRFEHHCACFVLRVGVALSAIWAVAGVSEPLQRWAPRCSDFLCSAGSRTFYSYVLHFPLMMVFFLVGFPPLVGRLPELGWYVLNPLLATLVVIILASPLTERLAGPLVMPLWILDVTRACALGPRLLAPLFALLVGGCGHGKDKETHRECLDNCCHGEEPGDVEK